MSKHTKKRLLRGSWREEQSKLNKRENEALKRYNKEHLDYTEKEFAKWEIALTAARKFLEAHREKLEVWHWGFSYHADEIKFCKESRWWDPDYPWRPKRIAAHFGKHGWVRVQNQSEMTYDWFKEVDGIKVVIESVEKIGIKFSKRVRL